MVRGPKVVRAVVWAGSLFTIAVLPTVSAAAPTPLPPTAKQRIVLDHSRLVALSTTAAIAHQPFPVVDPKTNNAVPPTQMLTGPNGEHVTAADYWANVNKFEKYLNDRGLSQRTAPPVSKIDRVRTDDALVQARKARIASVKKPVSAGLMSFESSGRLAPTPADIAKYSTIHTTHTAVLQQPQPSPGTPAPAPGPAAMARNAITCKPTNGGLSLQRRRASCRLVRILNCCPS